MPNNLTGQNISDTYQRLLQISSSGQITDGTGSIVIVPSASYAISASHEIILETSSSRAETAGTLSGLTTSVAELNYLDGITSGEASQIKNIDSATISTTQWGYVGSMNQAVASTNGVGFTNIQLSGHSGPDIELPSDGAEDNLHFAVRSELTPPGIFLHPRDVDKIISFVTQDGAEIANIDQAGVFSGTAATAATATTATNITSTANNSANESNYLTFVDGASGAQGIETDTGLRYNPSTGQIETAGIRLTSTTDASATSTGHAFQSGPTTGANIIINGNEVMARNNSVVAPLYLNPDGGMVAFQNSTGNNVVIGGGHVTASGNISASGWISGSSIHLPAQGKITFASDQFITGQNNSITIDGDNTVKIKADEFVTFVDNSNDVFVSIDPNAGHITATGNISSSGNINTLGNVSASNGIIAPTYLYPQSSSATVGDSTGDIITWGSSTSTTAGQIYYYNTSGGWTVADADAVSSGKGLLAVATGDSSADGMLIRGVTVLHTITGTQDEGAPIYLKSSADGHANIDAPTTSGHVVRILGYCLDNSNKKVWFDPDKTWVELS